MNPSPTWLIWLQWLGVLSAEVALAVASAALLQRFTTSAWWRRTLWQVCMLSLLTLPLVEFSGAARRFADWFVTRPSHGIDRADPFGVSRNSGPELPTPLTDEFRGRVAERLARNQSRESAGPLEAQPDSAQPPVLSAKASIAAGMSPRSSSDLLPTTQDRVADSMAVLYLGLGWITGTALVLARGCVVCCLLLLYRGWRRTTVNPALRARVETLARRLGFVRRIRVVESARLAGPIVFGVFRPVIGLPADFGQRFTPVQQEAILAHELGHLAGHDPLWYRLADLTGAILWWHPLVWRARRQLRAACEEAADEASMLVANGPEALAECLVQLSTRLVEQRSFLGAGGSGFRSDLGRRVERLLNSAGSEAPPGRLGSAFAKTLGTGALVTAAILCTAWVGPRAFTKGESMKTIQQTWNRSLTAFALLASLQGESQAASAVTSKREETAATTTGQAAQATNPAGAALPEKPVGESRQQMYRYNRLLAERYGLIPRGSAASTPQAAVKPGPVESKLEQLFLDEVQFDGVPLPQVLQFLNEESRKRDPAKQGVNFLINPNVPRAPGASIDPATGQTVAAAPPEPLDMNSIIVRFNLPLRNMRLKDVLDAVVKVADKPIEYSVEPYGVVFSLNPNQTGGIVSSYTVAPTEPPPLQVRTFKVDTNTFLTGLKRAFGAGFEPEENATADQIRSALRDVFSKLGINMDVPGKTVFYNDLTGIVMVRATFEDLEIVKAAVETLGGLPNDQAFQGGFGGGEGGAATRRELREIGQLRPDLRRQPD